MLLLWHLIKELWCSSHHLVPWELLLLLLHSEELWTIESHHVLKHFVVHHVIWLLLVRREGISLHTVHIVGLIQILG